MPHPALGLPPSDATAGHPELARRILASRSRLPALALDAALRADPGLRERHDELALRRILRDYEGHVDQLARALATGEERFVVQYGEWLVLKVFCPWCFISAVSITVCLILAWLDWRRTAPVTPPTDESARMPLAA